MHVMDCVKVLFASGITAMEKLSLLTNLLKHNKLAAMGILSYWQILLLSVLQLKKNTGSCQQLG